MTNPKSLSTALVFAAWACSTGNTSAGIVTSPEPGGLTTLATLTGASGVPANPSKWFAGENGASLFTYWSGDPLRYSVVLPASDDAWRLGVTAMNVSGPLKAGYTNFQVKVAVGGTNLGTLLIPASDTAWNTAWIDLGHRVGLTNVMLTWQNDSYKAGVYDANVSYGALQFASLSVPTPGTGSLAAVAFGLVALRPRRRPGAGQAS